MQEPIVLSRSGNFSMGEISPRQKASRALLEVFQCLSPSEAITLVALTCKDWLVTARSQELWICYFQRTFALQMERHSSAIDQFRVMLRKRKVLCLVSKTDVKVLHLDTLEMRSASIPELQRSRYAAWVTLPLGDVILCGGVQLPARTYLDSVYRLPYMGDTVLSLPSMLTPRAGTGLCLHKSQLYAFGGDNPDNLSSCEYLSLSSSHWLPLPDMLTPRRSFTPALHKEDIYLAGGGGSLRTIEVFHISSQDFDVLPIALPYIDSLACSLVIGNRLIILIRQKLMYWEIGSEEDLGEIGAIPGLFWFAPSGVQTVSEKSYFSPYYDSVVYVLDHQTFALSKVFESPSSP